MRLDDPNDEMAAVVAEAAAAGPRSRDRTEAFLAMVLDAEQAQRPWAVDEMAAILREGAAARFKRHWKPAPMPITIGPSIEVLVQSVVGIKRDGEWQQLPMGNLTVPEFESVMQARKTERDGLTSHLVALRRVARFAHKHGRKLGAAATLDDVLTARKVSLLDVMAGAA